MQNRDIRGGNGVHSSQTLAGLFARFRVMARRRSGDVALVSLAWGRDEAMRLAGLARDRVLADLAQREPNGRREDGVAAIYLEAWAGSATSGRWTSFGPRNGGFCHVFRRQEQVRKEAVRLDAPRSGTAVVCVLLAQRTRKGGWRASLVNRPLAGPVTNSADMPATAQPGQVVTLQVGAMSADGARIQFTWVPSKPAR